MVKIRKGFVTPGYIAWVPKPNLIIVAEERYARNQRLIAHELQHIKQHEKYGLAFYPMYLWGWIRAGFNYRRNWMEREARLAENDPAMLSWAKTVIKQNGY